MPRIVTVGAAQLGPISRQESRASAVARMIVLLRQAAAHGCDLVVFPECALTAFFPHWYYERQEELDAYFEREMPNAATQPLFDCARELGVGFYLGYAELAVEERRDAPLQHVDPRRQGRPDPRQVPQGPSARPRRARAAAPVPESGEALLRSRQPGLSGVPRVRRHRRHGDLQRPPLAGDLSRHGTAGRGDDRAGIQHAGAQSALARARQPRALPQRARDAGRRLPERLLGRRRGQGRRRGRRPPDRQFGDRRAVGRNRGGVLDRRRRARDRALRSRSHAVVQEHDVQLRAASAAAGVRA